jgi:hypothetical protein
VRDVAATRLQLLEPKFNPLQLDAQKVAECVWAALADE